MSQERECKISAKKIVINVRGARWETFESTLRRFPSTLLGSDREREKYFDHVRGEYRFDRNSHAFDAILFYYQSNGIISRPLDVDEEHFQDDLEFFNICTVESEKIPVSKVNHYAEMISSSFNARPGLRSPEGFVASLCCGFVFFSVVAPCVKPSSEYGVWELKALQCVFSSVFAAEFAARIFCARDRLHFLKSFVGIADLLAFVPFLLQLLLENLRIHQASPLLRMLQSISALKLSRYSNSLKRHGQALLQSRGQLCALLTFFFVNCLTFSCILLEVEYKRNEGFATVLDAMWFSVISMTTVGYGDIVPRTTFGKVCASISMVTGILTLVHLFLPVYISYYSIMLSEEKARRHAERMKRKELRRMIKSNMDPEEQLRSRLYKAGEIPALSEDFQMTSFSRTLDSMKYLESLLEFPRKKLSLVSASPKRPRKVIRRQSLPVNV